MKRALIVTGVWILFTLFVLYMVGPVAEHARGTTAGSELHDTQIGIGVFALVWVASLPLLGLMWIVVIFRWVLGGGKRPPPSIGYVAGVQAAPGEIAGPSSPKVQPAAANSTSKPANAGHRWLG